MVVIGLPRGMLGPHADRISGNTAATDTATRTLIATFLSGPGEHIADLPRADAHLADALAGPLIAAFADTTPERLDLASSLTDRILAFALANLADPTLCAHTVARRHGISARHLHHLLHRRGQTLAAWVREQRLHHIRRDLADPDLAARTTAAIAARWGVHDAGHLAWALKQRYGQTAVEIQRSGRSG